jgi:hypothetical protein
MMTKPPAPAKRTKAARKPQSRAKTPRKVGDPKRGPMPWKPTPAEIAKIKLYAGLGSTQEDIARLIGKASSTFRENEAAKSAFEEGKAEVKAKVAGKLVGDALAGNTTAQIFYLKTQCGWKETWRQEHTGADGGPIEYKDLGEDEVNARLAELQKRYGPKPLAH